MQVNMSNYRIEKCYKKVLTDNIYEMYEGMLHYFSECNIFVDIIPELFAYKTNITVDAVTDNYYNTFNLQYEKNEMIESIMEIEKISYMEAASFCDTFDKSPYENIMADNNIYLPNDATCDCGFYAVRLFIDFNEDTLDIIYEYIRYNYEANKDFAQKFDILLQEKHHVLLIVMSILQDFDTTEYMVVGKDLWERANSIIESGSDTRVKILKEIMYSRNVEIMNDNPDEIIMYFASFMILIEEVLIKWRNYNASKCGEKNSYKS